MEEFKKDDGFNREDSNRKEEGGFSRFAKDKRARTRIKRVEKAPFIKKEEGSERRSFNPNFTKDNKKRDDGQEPRTYGKPRENRDTDFNRTDFGKKEGRFDSRNQNKPFDKRGGKFNNDKKFRKDAPRTQRSGDDYPKFPQPKFEEAIRLNRYLAMAGVSSRREADELIKSGAVTVNGVVVTELGSKVEPTDIVQFEGNVVRSEKMVYIVMNKPKGYVTTLDDPHADKTVMDLLKNACKERIYPVGRLDKNSLGVLLVTNDGELTKRLTHPTYNKKKIYHVTLDKAVTKADMEQIVSGITLEDGEIHADVVNYVGDSRKEVGIEIHSGRNRIIRRIFDHLGYRVTKLDRVYFAGMTKKNLKRGAWRFLSAREVDMLKSGMYE